MKIGLLGGTFDPIHRGHTALARAAQEKFGLQRIYFVPAHIPPHKQRRPILAFPHRYAMVVLAVEGEKAWIPSLLDAPLEDAASARPSYSIETVRRLKASLKKADELFFLIGIDAFLDIHKWHEAEALLGECEFIVASRPGYSLADVAQALPEKLRPAAKITKPFERAAAQGSLVLPGVKVHLLEGVNDKTSATAVREAIRNGQAAGKMLDPRVAEYIKKQSLYR
jgi:nicotinate-nucleotide adenylyltransferase